MTTSSAARRRESSFIIHVVQYVLYMCISTSIIGTAITAHSIEVHSIKLYRVAEKLARMDSSDDDNE